MTKLIGSLKLIVLMLGKLLSEDNAFVNEDASANDITLGNIPLIVALSPYTQVYLLLKHIEDDLEGRRHVRLPLLKIESSKIVNHFRATSSCFHL